MPEGRLWEAAVDPQAFAHARRAWRTEAYAEVETRCRRIIDDIAAGWTTGRRLPCDDNASTLGRVVELALWAQNRCGGHTRCLALWDEATAAGWIAPDCVRARVSRGWALAATGRAVEARRLVVGLLERGGARLSAVELGEVLLLRARLDCQCGARPHRAREDMRQALSAFRRAGHAELSASARFNLAVVEVTSFSLVDADRLFRRAARYYRRAGRHWHLGYCLLNWAVCTTKLGRPAVALELLREAEVSVRRFDTLSTLIHVRLARAKALLEVSRRDEAWTVAEGALDRAQREQLPREAVIALEILGDVDLHRGDHEAADRRYRRALTIARRIDRRVDLVCGLQRRLGDLALARGIPEAARALGRQAVDSARRPGEFFEEGLAWHLRARCCERLGLWSGAYAHCRRGIEVLLEHGAALEVARLRLTAARVLLGWWSASKGHGVACATAAATDLGQARLESAWSCVVEALHAFAELERPNERRQCATLMGRLRREAEPPWRSSPAMPAAADDASDFVAGAPAMAPLLGLVETAAATTDPVLITGETGTGKEVVARAIHRAGLRVGAPIVAVNCAAIPALLFEREFFGHAENAFTGAVGESGGLCGRAEGGTLLLDEIGEMPFDLQPKLLRLLQEGTYRRLGEAAERRADLRVLASTNADLAAAMEAGSFRRDLFYRLQVLQIEIPPLRRRREDIDELIEVFARRATRGELGRRDLFDDEARTALRRYRWPGNIRELGGVVRRMVLEVTPGRLLGLAALPPEIVAEARFDRDRRAGRLDLSAHLAEAEKARIRQVLALVGGNRSEAARLLGISRNTLYKKLRRHGMGCVRAVSGHPPSGPRSP